MINLLNESILYRYASMILESRFSDNAIKKGDRWNFRCNVCGDSKKSKNKKRGWIEKTKKTNKLIYHCYNCGVCYNLEYWMKLYFPEYHIMYLNEILQTNEKKYPEIILQDKKEYKDKEENKDKFISLTNKNYLKDKLIQKAKNYVIRREIPKNVWEKWFVCIDGIMKNRLIIPFYNKNDEIYYWQGRSLYKKIEPKYLNCKYDKDQAIYNIDFIDKQKPVIVVEGVIDSLFIKNCISVLSTNWSEVIQKKLDKMDCYFLIDYDNSNDTKKRVEKLLKEGKKVFNWIKFIKDYNLPKKSKWDVNELILYFDKKFFIFEELENYFTNNYYDLIFFKGGNF